MRVSNLVYNLDRIREHAFKCHADTNHLYDGLPYSYHLDLTARVAMKFIRLIPEDDRNIVLAACYLHDVIEDCRVTYNDLREYMLDDRVPNIVYALTNEKGRNRMERASSDYYRGIQQTPYATFVKLCDRLANVFHSSITGSSMFDKYKKENFDFVKSIFPCVPRSHYCKCVFDPDGRTYWCTPCEMYKQYEPLVHSLDYLFKMKSFSFSEFPYGDKPINGKVPGYDVVLYDE